MTTFNEDDCTWTYADPKSDVVPLGSYLGKAILKKLKESDPNRIAEYNHEANEAITIKDIHDRTITVALNLQELAIGNDDIVAFYSRHNSYISSIVFGCYLNGNPWCPIDITNPGENFKAIYQIRIQKSRNFQIIWITLWIT